MKMRSIRTRCKIRIIRFFYEPTNRFQKPFLVSNILQNFYYFRLNASEDFSSSSSSQFQFSKNCILQKVLNSNFFLLWVRNGEFWYADKARRERTLIWIFCRYYKTFLPILGGILFVNFKSI